MLFKATEYFKKITGITIGFLRKNNIKGLILDVDNTLTVDKGTVPDKTTLEWISRIKQTNIKMILVSNGKRKRLDSFAKSLGLECFCMAMKPFPFKLKRAIEKLRVDKNSVLLVGDQVFTDILAANFAGIHSVLLDPIELEKSLSFRIRRFFERKIRANLKKEDK